MKWTCCNRSNSPTSLVSYRLKGSSLTNVNAGIPTIMMAGSGTTWTSLSMSSARRTTSTDNADRDPKGTTSNGANAIHTEIIRNISYKEILSKIACTPGQPCRKYENYSQQYAEGKMIGGQIFY